MFHIISDFFSNLIIPSVLLLIISSAAEDSIVFTSDRTGESEIWIMTADGSSQIQLTEHGGANPIWSPDGTRIAFERMDSTVAYQVWIMNADGREQLQLTTEGGSSPAWSPDGKQIAFNSDRTSETEIWIMSADGSSQIQLTEEGGEYPIWSPGGSLIAFSDIRFYQTQIFVVDTNGNNERALTSDSTSAFMEAWNHNGSVIAFVSDRDGDYGIWTMNSDGDQKVQIARNRRCFRPQWSPDDTSLAYYTLFLGEDERVCIIDINDGDPVELTGDGCSNPRWNSDGSRITYVCANSDSPQIWAMDTDGSKKVQLTFLGGSNPHWRPIASSE